MKSINKKIREILNSKKLNEEFINAAEEYTSILEQQSYSDALDSCTNIINTLQAEYELSNKFIPRLKIENKKYGDFISIDNIQCANPEYIIGHQQTHVIKLDSIMHHGIKRFSSSSDFSDMIKN